MLNIHLSLENFPHLLNASPVWPASVLKTLQGATVLFWHGRLAGKMCGHWQMVGGSQNKRRNSSRVKNRTANECFKIAPTFPSQVGMRHVQTQLTHNPTGMDQCAEKDWSKHKRKGTCYGKRTFLDLSKSKQVYDKRATKTLSCKLVTSQIVELNIHRETL